MDKADPQPEGAKREELLHEARKSAKRARYAAESVSSAFGKHATAFAAAMEGMQEALGEHQDSVVARQRLRELAGEASNPGTAFTCGRCTHSKRPAGSRSDDGTGRPRGRRARSPCIAGSNSRSISGLVLVWSDH